MCLCRGWLSANLARCKVSTLTMGHRKYWKYTRMSEYVFLPQLGQARFVPSPSFVVRITGSALLSTSFAFLGSSSCAAIMIGRMSLYNVGFQSQNKPCPIQRKPWSVLFVLLKDCYAGPTNRAEWAA